MIYVVKSGDTLYRIAKIHGLTLQRLLELNPGITNPDRIYVGEKIVINKDLDAKKKEGSLGIVDFFVKDGWRVTSDYGIRRDPFSGKNSFHRGIDFGGKPAGEPIKTPVGGMVMYSAYYDGWGNLVGIQDNNGFIHIFAHLDKLGKVVGAKVEQGEIVGLNGSTGNSTGPHLHYQINTPRGGIVGVNAHGDPKIF